MSTISRGNLSEFQKALETLSLSPQGRTYQYRDVQRTALEVLNKTKSGCTFNQNELQQVLVTFLNMKDGGGFDRNRQKDLVVVNMAEKAVQDTLRALKILRGTEIQHIDFQNGIKYIGEVQNGQPHGKGKYVFPNGSMYWGDVQYDRFHGKGRLYEDGQIYEGEFQYGERHGHGKIIGPLGFEGEFYKDSFLSDLSHIKDLLFLHLLIGESNESGPASYALGIMAPYLKEKGHTNLSEELESAHAILLGKIPNPETFIMNKLQRNEPQLIVLETEEHTLGMKIVPIASTNRIELRIYNSGAGLEKYHNFNSQTGKFYTLNVNIPKDQMTEKRLQTFFKIFDIDELDLFRNSLCQLQVVDPCN